MHEVWAATSRWRRGPVLVAGIAAAVTVALVLVVGLGSGGSRDPLSDDVLPVLPADLEIVGGRATTCEVDQQVRECHRIVALAGTDIDGVDITDRVTGLFTIGEWSLCETGWEVDAGPCVVAIDSFAKWQGAGTSCARLCDRAVAVLLVDARST